MHRATVTRHRPICKMADQFPDVSLGFCFDSDVLYGLENENGLLPSIDVNHPVSASTSFPVIESEVSKEVTDGNTEPISDINKQKFANMHVSAEIDEIITRGETKNTKDNTKWAVRVFEGKL